MSKRLDFDDAVRTVAGHLPLRGYSRDEWVSTLAERRRETYRHIVGTIERHLPPGARILDYGAGMCDKTVLAQLRGYRCTAADDFNNPLHGQTGYGAAILDFARQFDVEVVPVKGALPFERGSFDMVMMHDVIEHLHDSPRELLNDLVELLPTGGYLFITVPSAVNIRKRIDVLRGRTNLPRFDTYYWYPGPFRGHVREYTRGDLHSLSRYLGLQTVELHAVHHMLSVLPRPMRLLYRAITSVLRDWRDSWCFVGRKPEGWAAVREVRPDELAAIQEHLNR